MNTVHHPATPHTIAQSQTSSTDRPTNEDAKIHRLAKRLFVIIGEWWQSVKTAVSTIVQRTHRSPEPQATTTAQRTDNASHDVIAQQGNPIPPQGSPPTTRVLTQEERRNQDENTKMREALLPLFQSFGREPPLEGLERSHLRWLTTAHVQLSEALASASYEQIQKAEEQLNAFDETIRQVSQQERAFEQQYKNDREKLGSELDAIAKLPQPEYLRQTEQQETLDREKLNQAREKLEQARENFAGVVRGSPEELDKAQGQLTTAQKEFQQASEQFKTAREKATKARKRWNEDLASKKEAISKKYSLETRREDHENSEVMRTGRFNTRLSGHPVFRLMRAAIQEQAQQVHQLKNAFENARTALRLETSLQMPEEEHSFQAFQRQSRINQMIF